MNTTQRNTCQASEAVAWFPEPLPRHILKKLHGKYPNALGDMEWAIVYGEIERENYITPFAHMFHNFIGVYSSWDVFASDKLEEFLDWCREAGTDTRKMHKVQALIDYLDYDRYAADLEEDYLTIYLADGRVVIIRNR